MLAILALTACRPVVPPSYQPAQGDVVFQALPLNPLVQAIEGTTGSPYSHCGLLTQRNGEWWVLEAIGPVKATPLREWVRRGRGGWFTAYRFKPKLQPKIPEIMTAARTYLGRPYDRSYRFDDEKIYCSELIYKAVRDATGETPGQVFTLGQLNWRPYEKTIRRLEGNLPLDREMITPRDLATAPQLERVYPAR
jgi:hypothetical protein